jgi:two-component system, sensor histidine kinase RegB
VVVREIERALDPQSPHAEDVKLLREQAQRCREILSKITELPAGDPFDRMPISALIEEAVAPHRNLGVSIGVNFPPNRAAEPIGARNPAIRYGLGNLIENAVDFARRRVEIFAEWTAEEVSIIISDDGPGFAPEVVDRIGAPYVTHRRPESRGPEGDDQAVFGLGLGFFIAKTLLERSGAKLALTNQAPPLHGATIAVTWSRADFERPPASPALEAAVPAS